MWSANRKHRCVSCVRSGRLLIAAAVAVGACGLDGVECCIYHTPGFNSRQQSSRAVKYLGWKAAVDTSTPPAKTSRKSTTLHSRSAILDSTALSNPAVFSLTHGRCHKTRCQHPHAGGRHSLGWRDLHRHRSGGYLFGQALKSHPAGTHRAWLFVSQATGFRLREAQRGYKLLITASLSFNTSFLGGARRTRRPTACSLPRRVRTHTALAHTKKLGLTPQPLVLSPNQNARYVSGTPHRRWVRYWVVCRVVRRETCSCETLSTTLANESSRHPR